MLMLTSIVLLSLVLGFSLGIYLIYQRAGLSVSGMSIFITALMGTVLSFGISALMIFAVWPPVNIVSWIAIAGLVGSVALLLLSDKDKSEKGGGINGTVGDYRADLRSSNGL